MKKAYEPHAEPTPGNLKDGRARAALWACLLLSAALCFGRPAHADGSAAPGRAVGHVILGMDRADVWKILHKPGETVTVPHGMSLYSEDTWTGPDHTLSVVSERDRVIQAEFDSPYVTTTDGLSTLKTLDRIRRRHPNMSVREYDLPFSDFRNRHGTGGYYVDDVRGGIAFVMTADDGIDSHSLNMPPERIVIHRPGCRAVPIYDGRWVSPAPADEDPAGLHLLRSWLTPGPARPGRSQ